MLTAVAQPPCAIAVAPYRLLNCGGKYCSSLIILLVLAFLIAAAARSDEPEQFAIIGIQQDSEQAITLTWESCTNYIYGVLSADEPDVCLAWPGQIAMWGEDGQTSWTDATASNVDQRFYRVVRMSPDGDFDGDQMPNAWELQYGLNLFDANDAQADSDGDGANNLTEYLQGRDPTKGVVADSESLVNLSVFTLLE